MPVFAMAPGAIAAFSGSRLCHGTLEHDAERDRAEGHEAHVSFAIQIPSPIHGLKRVDVQDFDEDMLAKGRQDAAGLKDAVWVPVWDFNKHGGMPTSKISFSHDTMVAMPWKQVVPSGRTPGPRPCRVMVRLLY